MQFCSEYDEALAASGPPSVFLRTLEGFWRVEPNIARDGCERLKQVPERIEGHGLMRDTATGFVSRIYTTGRGLFDGHPRVELTWCPTEQDADEAFAALGNPPIQR